MGVATLFWTAAGYEISCVGNAFDISDTGFLIEAPECILAGTATFVQINRSGQRMEATVRYCRKHGAWYRIGLEFKAMAVQPETASLESTWQTSID